MKKLFSSILAVLMIFSCFTFSAFAKEYSVSDGNAIAIAVEDVADAKAGDTVTVKISAKFADGHAGISDGMFTLNYPTDKLELVVDDYENPTTLKWLFPGAMIPSITVTKDNPGTIIAGFISMANNATAGDFFELQFKVKEGFTGAADITFDKDAADTYFNTSVNFMPEAVGVDLVDGAINVPAEKYDVTYDANLEGVTSPDAETDVESGTEIDLPVLEDTDSFRFLGWQVNGEGDVLTGKYTVTADTTLKGAWAEIKKYDVTFATTYGTAPEAMTDVVENTEITLPTLADTDDYTFEGWSDGETTHTDTYKVTADITLNAVWNEIIKYTVTFNEGDIEPMVVVAGDSIELPELTSEDLSFLGWTAEGSDEVLTGTYTPAASVLLTAKWGGAKKVYISADGNDTNSGFTQDAPVATLPKAYEIINTEGNTIEEIIVIGVVPVNGSAVNAEGKGTAWNFGIDGKALTFKGLGEGACIYVYGNSGLTDTAIDGHRFYFKGDVTLENITFNSTNTSEVPYAFGEAKSLTINDGVKFLCRTSKKVDGVNVLDMKDRIRPLAASDYTDPIAKNLDVELNLNDTDINSGTVYAGFGYAGNTRTGTVTVNHNKGTLTILSFSKGSTGTAGPQVFNGTAYYNINGGKITNLRFGYGMSYHGLGYATINDGEITKIYTTGINSSYATWTTVVQQENSGVRVWEINGGTVGAIERENITNESHQGFEDAFVNVKRVVIFNDGVEAITVSDDAAIVLDVTGAKLSADVTVAEDYTTTLNGFAYTMLDGGLAAEYNAVKVGDKIYRLDELENGLIPAPEAAGVYEVSFLNVYKVTVDGEVTMIPEGESIELERLAQNGDLKHVGWATTENAETAEIDGYTKTENVITYTPDDDIVLYPVWATATIYTATFESEHGEVPAPISKIDDDDDGKADEAITFPGYEGKQDEHFTFAGWFDKAYAGAPEGTVVPTYNAGDTLVLEGSKTFIAKWTEDPKATVTYVDEAAAAPEAVTDYVGTEITIAAPGAVEGFEFLGWTDGTTVYQAGDKLIIDEDGATLTAKWGVKVAVDANGAKGTAPVIGGEIGEEIDLPATVELTKVNNTFKGWALSADGEVITGKYMVNPEDTLYAIWEEVVADAAIIETKVVYNSATSDYTVDMYFYGADANTVAFGYTYGENLEFVSFAPAAGLVLAPDALEVNEAGYYANVVTNQDSGKIEAADATAGNGVHLGTITLSYKLTKEDYSDDDATDNIAVTAPKSVVENVSSAEYFLYTPAVAGLEVIGLPVVFDEAIEYEIVDVVYAVKGSVKVVRKDGTAPKNYAEIEVYNEQGNLYKTFVIEDEATTTVDGVFNYEIGLGAGNYTFVVKKTGYLDYTFDVEIVVQEGADQEGFVPTPVDVELVTLVAGDVVADKGVIDLLDFAGITQVFGTEYDALSDTLKVALDIDEDGTIGVFDLNYVKVNFGAKAN